MKTEIITKKGRHMIVLNIKLDNYCAFKDFEMNLTYPKKIVGSYIENEHLLGFPNFRYKKVNILMGANASGKTTFGKILMRIFNFIDKKNYDRLVALISDKSKPASFQMDFVSVSDIMYRIDCTINPDSSGRYSSECIDLNVRSVVIGAKDSYESCVNKLLAKKYTKCDSYIEELEKIEEIDWLFEYPSDSTDGDTLNLRNTGKDFTEILEKTLKCLDTAIQSVRKSNEVEDAYVIQMHDKSVVIQHGEKLQTGLLSSGTKAGIGVAKIISSIVEGTNSFYYCDEKFSYIHSDIEKAVLTVMIDMLRPNEQLFFTTHNTDILELNLPKHAYTFMKKCDGEESYVNCIYASSYLKRNTDSLRNAVENDLFSVAPSVDGIFDLLNM